MQGLGRQLMSTAAMARPGDSVFRSPSLTLPPHSFCLLISDAPSLEEVDADAPFREGNSTVTLSAWTASDSPLQRGASLAAPDSGTHL